MTQYNDWIAQLARDGRGGGVFPSISRGRSLTLKYSLSVHPILGDFTDGTFSCNIAISPDAPEALTSFEVSTGVPENGVTPVTLSLPASAQSGFPQDDDFDGIERVFYELVYTPNGAGPIAVDGGIINITGAI